MRGASGANWQSGAKNLKKSRASFLSFPRRKAGTEEKSGDRGSRAPSLNARESLREAKVQASLANMGFANIWATKAECNGKGQRRW